MMVWSLRWVRPGEFQFTRNTPKPRDLKADVKRRRAAAYDLLDHLCRVEALSVIAMKDPPPSDTAAQLRIMGHRAEPQIVSAMVSEYVAWKMIDAAA